MLIELCLDYPQVLLRAIGHPVTWIGRLIAALDRLLNRDAASPQARRGAGIAALLIVLGIVGSIAAAVAYGLFRLPFGFVLTAVIASPLIAQRSLHQHVTNVAIALEQGGLAAGRAAVSHIVGRDTDALDEAGVARAAIESLDLVAGHCRAPRSGTLQSNQHRRQYDRPSHAAARGVRLGRGPARRSGQSAGLAAVGVAAHRRGRAAPGRFRGRGVAHRLV
jgi:hypothetical protein